MATSQCVTFPALQAKPRYVGVPRRYEETRPVTVQNLTHRRILDIGSVIHSKNMDRFEREKEINKHTTEEEVWAEADIIKDKAIEKILHEAKLEQEKVIKRMVKAHNRTVKEEVLRVEGEMKQLAIKQVQVENQAGEVRLREAVEQTKMECHQQLLLAVEAARTEEIEIAADKMEKQARQNKLRLELALRAAADEKDGAMRELRLMKDREKMEAVEDAHTEERGVAAEKLTNQKRFYNQQIQVLQTYISEGQDQIAKLEDQIQMLIDTKNGIENELWETRVEFEKFIGSVKPFCDGDSSYLMPPSRTIQSA